MNIQNHIIFTHYGSSSYLSKTLKCVKVTNPSAKIILIGDENNLDSSNYNQIEHRHFDSLKESNLRTDFYQLFKPVKGVFHPLFRNGRNWLKYVFERWFYVYELSLELNLESFWHFDSDTMILEDLTTFNQEFSVYDATEQCNGSCLNGFVKTKTLEQYLKFINQLFLDDNFLKEQQYEFDNINPEYAFTEMRAWIKARQTLIFNTCHIGKVINGKTWDDCIVTGCEIGYEMINLKSGQNIKNLYWDNGFYCYNRDLKESVKFVSLNLSHAPIFVFDWVLSHINRNSSVKYLSQASAPWKEIFIGLARNFKRKVIFYLSRIKGTGQ